MIEEWRAVPGFEGIYEVSSLGRVHSVERDIVIAGISRRLKRRSLIQRQGPYGHYTVTLTLKNTRTIARVADLMMLGFVGPASEGQEAVHKDCDLDNNTIGNLEYGPCRDMELYENSGNAKLVDKMARDILYSTDTVKNLAIRYNVAEATIRHIKHRKTWKHIV